MTVRTARCNDKERLYYSHVSDVVHFIGTINEYITNSFFLMVTEVMCRCCSVTANERDYQFLIVTLVQF